MLRPGPGNSPELVARNQRERLLAATVVAVADRGYERTAVAEILRLSGISRTTFYQHFPGGKQEAVLAAVDAAMGAALGAVERAWTGDLPWEERVATSFEAVAQSIVDQPAAAKLCLVEVYAAGPAGLDHADEAAQSFHWLLDQAFGQSPERAGLPPTVSTAIVGGTRKVLEARVARDEAGALPGLTADLTAWALAYRTPPVALRRPRSRPLQDGVTRFIVHDQVERIFGAVAAAVEEKGYPAMTLDDIAKNASASLTTFYQHFDGKEEAFLAAYDTAMAQAAAAAMPPYRWTRGWPLAVRAALEAFLGFLAAEPTWARITMVDVLTAGPRALEHRDRAMSFFAEILEVGYGQAPDLPPLAVEAIGGAIHALIYEQIRRRGPQHLAQILPAATYVALAPFVGTEEATAVANKGALRAHRGASTGRSRSQHD
jgi:AcrR family transcriptional regulator